MRNIAAAALALPVLVPLYALVILRRTLAGRAGIGIGVVAIAGILAIGLAVPGATVAPLPVVGAPLGPVALAGSIESGHGLREPVRLSFSEAMDVASVTQALSVQPSPAAALTVHTALAPSVVRFRPLNGTIGVAPTAVLSVRFTARMDRASAAAAFRARVGGTKLRGRISWAEGDTVLVFVPATALGYGAKVVMEVGGSAIDRIGTPLRAGRSATFAVEKKPAPRSVRPASGGSSSGSVHISTGGGSVGSGAWHAVETYYLKLMNCTRGGGWVTSAGNCSSPGGSGIAPLALDAGISDRVSRPYAKLLVTRNICSHFVDGNPGDRLHRAGYAGDYRENIGCLGGSPYASVLETHLFFQSEKPCGGYCHYANIMSRAMKHVGIGVWVYGGRVRLVIDFWER